MDPAADLVSMAKAAAVTHEIEPELVCAVVEQESGWETYATRYEPAFFTRYIAPLLTSGVVLNPTEGYARATSWGLMQVLGQVAREHGFLDRVMGRLCDPPIGLDIGCRVLSHKITVAEGNVSKALLLWNGGGNPAYPDQVLARVARYR